MWMETWALYVFHATQATQKDQINANNKSMIRYVIQHKFDQSDVIRIASISWD